MVASTQATIAYWASSGACGSMNWGRNADMNSSALGLVSATMKLRNPSVRPAGRSAADAADGRTSAASERSIFQPR
ncbi:hypothetical protein G6F57_023857 [Rhizopus arrhizus]|nr:hypothetical protein G6F57_023857 [Rhizopus arrhizus]